MNSMVDCSSHLYNRLPKGIVYDGLCKAKVYPHKIWPHTVQVYCIIWGSWLSQNLVFFWKPNANKQFPPKRSKMGYPLGNVYITMEITMFDWSTKNDLKSRIAFLTRTILLTVTACGTGFTILVFKHHLRSHHFVLGFPASHEPWPCGNPACRSQRTFHYCLPQDFTRPNEHLVKLRIFDIIGSI